LRAFKQNLRRGLKSARGTLTRSADLETLQKSFFQIHRNSILPLPKVFSVSKSIAVLWDCAGKLRRLRSATQAHPRGSEILIISSRRHAYRTQGEHRRKERQTRSQSLEVRWSCTEDNMSLGDYRETALSARKGRVCRHTTRLFRPMKFHARHAAENEGTNIFRIYRPFYVEDKTTESREIALEPPRAAMHSERW